MATETRNLGLAALELGDIAADGGVATTFTAWGVTYKDTAEITQEDGEKFEHYAEEMDEPIEVIQGKGKTTIKWSTVDYTPDRLVKSLGGTKTGAMPNEKWEAPDSIPEIEQSIKITPKKGKPFVFPRVSIVTKINYKLARNGIALLEHVGTVLQPTKSGVKSAIYG